MNRKIAFVLNNLSGGGAERVAVTIANELSLVDYKVDLILNKKNGAYLNDVGPEVNIISLNSRMLFAMPKLLNIIRTNHYDAVLTVLDQPSIACLLLKPFLPKTKVIVIECNNPLMDGEVKSKVWRIARSLRVKLYPQADHIITKSEGIKRILHDKFNVNGDNATSISNPVDLEKISNLKARNHDDHSIGNADGPLFVAVGRLSFQKDFEGLIEAFSIVNHRVPSKLMILGEGEHRAEIERNIKKHNLCDRVSLLGFQSNPYSIVSKANVFVMSSRWEGWPNALVEAMACGVTPVSTDCESGPRDILEGGKLGYLVPVEDYTALADAMVMALEHPIEVNTLMDSIRKYHPTFVSEKYKRVIDKVIGV